MSTFTLEQGLQMAMAHHQAGQLPQAEALYRQILAVQPQQPDALHLLGVIASQVGQPAAAVELIGQAIALNPNDAAYHCNLGEAYRGLQRMEDAIACYRRALTIDPGSAPAHFQLGALLHSQNQIDEAIAWYKSALILQPDYAQAHSNLGLALHSQGQETEAIASYRRALEIHPSSADAHYNLGIALLVQKQNEEAGACFQQALALRPDYGEAWNNLGAALFNLDRLDEAVSCFERARTFQPGNVEVVYNLGNIFRDQGRLEEAVAAYREVVRLAPDDPAHLSSLLYWLHMHPSYDARALLQEHQLWEQRFGTPRRGFHRPHANTPDPNKRLKIGYVSPYLRNSPIGRFLLPLFENHDHEHFEITCYADVSQRDHITARLHACADGWKETTDCNEEQMAERIIDDGVDILVDLSLHAGRNRMAVFAHKPAPVQVTYLAYCSTSGLDTMDYRLTDPYLDPPGGDDSVYSEASIRLPDTYWCYPPPQEAPDVSPLPALTAGQVTFGCFNLFSKVNAPVLALWTKLLQAVPKSRMVLYAPPKSHWEQAQDRLAAENISAERLLFVDHVPLPEYFASYGQVDIALDPFPYAGGTTTCDALWMGVPVVTLVGRTAVGRGGVSILSNIGLPELIAASEEEYMRIAVDLANDLPRLAELRATMRDRMQASPLMDGPRFTQGIEAAYRQMWTTWCQGRPQK